MTDRPTLNWDPRTGPRPHPHWSTGETLGLPVTGPGSIFNTAFT